MRLFVSVLALLAAMLAAPIGSAGAAPTCDGVPATIVGTSGPDTLVGTHGVDVIVGLAGDDTIRALRGDDIVCGGDGDDTIDGGADDDAILGGDGADDLHGGDGDDRIFAGDGDDVVTGGAGDDRLFAGHGDDYADGGPGNDMLRGGRGADELLGGWGNDVVVGGDSFEVSSDDPNILRGGQGNDSLFGGMNSDTMNGGTGNDALIGYQGADVMKGGPGDDTIDGGTFCVPEACGDDGDPDTAIGGTGRDQCAAETAFCEEPLAHIAVRRVRSYPGSVELTGVVHHSEPVAAVTVGVRDNATGMWLQDDYSFDSHRHRLDASVVPTPDGADFSVGVMLPVGRYNMSVIAVDSEGDAVKLRPWNSIRVRQPVLAIGVPMANNLSHFESIEPLPSGSTLGYGPVGLAGNQEQRGTRVVPGDSPGPAVRLTGALMEQFGNGQIPAEVTVEVIDDAGSWLQPDGSFGSARSAHVADLVNGDGSSSYWLIDVDIAEGSYTARVEARVTATGVLLDAVDWEFTADADFDAAPTITVDFPFNSTFAGPFIAGGTVTTDVYKGRIRVRERGTDQWMLIADGDAALDGAGGWSVAIDLPPGDYTMSVRMKNHLRYEGSVTPWHWFTVTE